MSAQGAEARAGGIDQNRVKGLVGKRGMGGIAAGHMRDSASPETADATGCSVGGDNESAGCHAFLQELGFPPWCGAEVGDSLARSSGHQFADEQ